MCEPVLWIRSTGTELHQTWAETWNMVSDIQPARGALGSSSQTFKKKPQKRSNHMQVTTSQVLLVELFSLFCFPRELLVNTFAQVCSQHICTVVCSLTHKLCGTHSLSLWHTQTNPGAYVISSMHMIPHTQTHTHTLTYQIRLLLLVGSPQEPLPRTTTHKGTLSLIVQMQFAVASQPASPQMPLT